MRILFVLFVVSNLWGESWSVVVSKECASIKPQALQNIYLKKQRFIEKCRLVPLNFRANNYVREHVMTNILKVSKKSWNHYYNEMHFKGIDPPNIVDSEEAMLKYLSSIKGAVGYVRSQNVHDKLHVIIEFTP